MKTFALLRHNRLLQKKLKNIFTGLLLCLYSQWALAKMTTWTVGSLCPSAQFELTLINPTNENLPVWIFTDFDRQTHEDSYEILAKSKLKFSGIEINNQDHGFLLKSMNENLQLQAQCGDRIWTPNQFTSSSKRILSTLRSNYYVTNLNHDVQTFEFQFKDSSGFILHTERVLSEAHLQTTTYKFTPPEGTAFIDIHGEGRFNLQVENPLDQKFIDIVDLKADLNPKNEGSYFLVRQQSGNESFVIHLTDPNQIQKARFIIQNKLSKMVIAVVAAGPANYNRNHSDSLKTPWSWNIEKVLNFSDFASVDCNVSPGQIEERRNEFLESDRGGLACFWGFFPTKELQPWELK